MQSPGLLDDLRRILERGAVEVRTFLSEGVTETIDEHAFGSALRDHILTWSPDAVVLSDRLNGSKYVARRLARENNIGVLTLKQSVFPGRAYFAPDPARQANTSELHDKAAHPLEKYEHYRLGQFLAADRTVGHDSKLYKKLAHIRPVLLVVDHSSEDLSWPQDWYAGAVDAIISTGRQALVCYRLRDICDAGGCEQSLVLDDGYSLEHIQCASIGIDRVIRASLCMITNGSLLGLKALYTRKQVFVVGDFLYSGMGFTHDVPYGRNFAARIRMALESANLTAAPHGYERFLYDFIFRDLLPLEEGCARFADGTEGRVVDALFRALPIERGARVLTGG